MSASRLGRIEELFHEALARPAGERRAFVSEASDDTELVREVNALLEDHDSAAGYFQELTLKLADSATSELEGVASTGMVIGAYRTVRLLGRGGMGSVFLAERADGHYSQQVAVKLIRRGMDSEDLIRRFVSERQILARLNHPNIARLLDGGLSEDDRPYLILEYIEGTPLTTYCDDRHLDIDARLKLFIRVGRAVAYAHGSLVVHRDLKPSNIVVTRKGVVKLLDFGIAKILSEEGSEQRTHTVTVTGSRILTPEYAAPEQITGGAITTATDVYGLGVVLYELLTGSRPLTLTDGSLVELERRVLEQASDSSERLRCAFGEARRRRAKALDERETTEPPAQWRARHDLRDGAAQRARAPLPIRGAIHRGYGAASGRTARFRASGYTRLSCAKIRPAPQSRRRGGFRLCHSRYRVRCRHRGAIRPPRTRA